MCIVAAITLLKYIYKDIMLNTLIQQNTSHTQRHLPKPSFNGNDDKGKPIQKPNDKQK